MGKTKSGEDFRRIDGSGLHCRSDDATMLETVSPGPWRPIHEGQAMGQRTQPGRNSQ